MAAFVLVHGSGQNASSWSRVRRLLEERGHLVATPDLPKQAPDWALEDYAAEIARFVTEPDTILVGHSQSGCFIPLVPRLRECAALVFFAAAIPEPGRSLRDQFTADASMFHPEWIEAGARWFDESQREAVSREFLFHDCAPEALDWALSTSEVLDCRHTVSQPCPLDAWLTARAVCVVASLDRTLNPDWCRRASRERLGVEPLELRAGHCPHVSIPGETAALLERLAGGG